jgi:hypothetical protein
VTGDRVEEEDEPFALVVRIGDGLELAVHNGLALENGWDR